MPLLLIDPDPAQRQQTRQMLTALGDSFLEAASIAEAIPVLESANLRLAVIEHALPDGNGLTLFALIRQRRPNLPVILLTGHGDEELAVSSLRAGLADYVSKRQPARLLDAARAALLCPGYRGICPHGAGRLQEADRAALLDRVHDAILVCDLDDRITYWNQGAQHLFGWSDTEVLGVSVVQLLWSKEPEQLTAVRRALTAQGAWRGEARLTTRRGEERTFDLSQTRVLDEAGRPRAVVTIGTDITERRQLEGRFLRAQRLESIGTLAGGIAHDLNNVLTPIRLGADLLRRIRDDEKRQTLLDAITFSVNRGVELLNQILDFARGQEGTHQPVALATILTATGKMLRHSLPQSIRLNVSVTGDLGHVLGDVTQLSQVVVNLAVNGRDAMPEGGRLDVRACNVTLTEADARAYPEARPGRYALVTVSDTGCGIAPEHLDKIFDPFFTTKQVGQGTGLGLSTVRGIVRRHNGFLDVESNPDRGTTFRVWLPLTEAEPPTATAEPSLPRGEQQVVLLVDDEPSICALVRDTLETAGYRVLTAANGAEALALFSRQGDIAVAVIDLHMPVLDGRTTIRALRQAAPHLPILPASGLPPTEGLGELGLTAFLPKPYTAHQLLKAIRELLENTNPSRDP